VNSSDIDAILESGWSLLEAGASNRKVMMHTPVVASLNHRGHPDQRVMVLRHAIRSERLLRFHTDARAPKVGQVQDGAPVHILAYEADARVQLRMSGHGWVSGDGPEADAGWQDSSLFARRCYLSHEGPGSASAVPTSGLPRQVEGRKPSEDQVAPGRKNFAVLTVRIDCMDWFSLSQTGHRRALIEWEQDCPHGRWLVP
jgi:hypothetical protein